LEVKWSVLIKRKLKSEYSQFRKEATWLEFAFWCVGWVLLGYALIVSTKEGRNPQTILVIKAQSSATVLILIFHLLPRKIFLARISYRTQTWVMILVLAAAFVGKYLYIYSIIPWYDFYLHAFGCFICVFAGYELAKSMKYDDKPLEPVIGAVCGFGLSFFAAVVWEMFEFVCDQFFDGNTQNWKFSPSEKFLTALPTDPARFPLMDTMTDLISGAVGSLIGGIVIFAVLCAIRRRTKPAVLESENSVRK
jgi:hypothetical protein